MAAEITVTVPATAEYVHVLRAVVASVASRMEVGYDAIEELRIVVDEASALLLRLPSAGPELILEAKLDGGSVHITVCVEAEAGAWPDPGIEQGLAWKILGGLTDEAAFVQWDGRPAVRVKKQLSSLESG